MSSSVENEPQPPQGQASRHEPQSVATLLESQVAMKISSGVGDIRDHEDFSAQIESDVPPRPRVKLPDLGNYVAPATTDIHGKEELEEGEIDEVDQLDGADIGDMDLDNLLQFEEDEADDYDLYDQLQAALPRDLAEEPVSKVLQPVPQRPNTGGLRPSPLFAQGSPSAPPAFAPPEPAVERFDVWVTNAEYALYQHPQLRRWRVKRPSRLRTCWIPVEEDSESEDDSTVL
ncbi:hypothetical protein EG329_011992 [Mollisiaceae sp. DMI_Dod_QoI]|nr:hypothetical protein EG329_011992 [Helotiales sp. DMI_Dod_QoI]